MSASKCASYARLNDEVNTQGLSLPDGLIIVDDIYSGDGRNDLTLWNDGSIKQCLDGLNLKRITDDQYLEPVSCSRWCYILP